MITQFCSMDEVISRIIRNTRITDVSYIQDMMEWIPEAMELMKTRYQLVAQYADIEIAFHKGRLPCGLVELEAVEFEGKRLPWSSTEKNYMTGHKIGVLENGASDITTFKSVIETKPNDTYFDENNIMWTSDIRPDEASLKVVSGCDVHPSNWYKTEMGYIVTSIVEGTLRLHYYALPMDDKGLPVIPDNGNYKEALYYFVRAKMIGAGYEDKVYKEPELLSRFELHAGRAIAEIRYPSVDKMEQQIKTLTRLIPPANWWENFSRVDNHEMPYLT